MLRFEYLRVNSIEEASRLLAEHGPEARGLAGGTDLMVQFHERDKRWAELKYVVDFSGLTEMKYIRETATTVEIGALTTHTELNLSPIVQKWAGFLSLAAGTVGSAQVRNLGTIGGSIGNASPAADPLTPLIALEAEAVLACGQDQRRAAVKDIYVKSSVLKLAPGEIITGFTFRKPAPGSFSAFEKLGRRKALAISRMNVAALLRFDGEVIAEARICPGCVFAIPDRVPSAENILIGQKPDPALFAEAGREVSAEMIRRTGVRWSTEYKKPVIEALVPRALTKAWEARR